MASKPGTQPSIPREENLILQQVFGYDDRNPLHTERLPRIGSPGSSIRDILFLSVDVDTGGGYEVISPHQSFHVGISIFDTRYFISKSFAGPQQAIRSYQFINQNSKPCKRAARRFLLGPTEILTLPDIATQISIFTQDRDYILVGHGLNEDLKFLNNVDPDIVAGACYILDTVKAAQYTLQLYYRYGLEKLLDALSIPYGSPRLHAAGNDAFFALKGLLMITARDLSAKAHPSTLGGSTIGTKNLITTLEAIARAPYPIPPKEPQEPPALETQPKLSLRAKGRLRAERKALRRSEKSLASSGELRQDDSHCLDST